MRNERIEFVGSSPLARGTHSDNFSERQVTGLIPARAGNTVDFFEWPPRCWAHPRSRGEHVVSHSPLSSFRGSSPLARGTRNGRSVHKRRDGLIPARAGNTLKTSSPVSLVWAHPRSRGEHLPGEHESGAYEGSSPLARGTPFRPRSTISG